MNARFTLVLVLVALAGCTTPRDFDPESSHSTPRVDAPAPVSQPRVVRITAKKFEYSPAKVVLAKGEPVVLELVSLDRKHGFAAPDLGLRADIEPDHVTRLELTPLKAGTFEYHCDVFCGSGHENMSGEIVVEEK
jgi:cytochrome c oxidase subunit 2